MPPISDLTFLRTFANNDPAKITKYVNMFLNSTPNAITTMKKQLAESDWKGLQTAAHSMKSQLKYMGATSAVDLAYAIERSAADNTNLEQVPELLNRLEESASTIIMELRDALTKL